MYLNKWITSSIALGITTLFSSTFCAPTHADVYHAVAQGETLSAIAARYQTSTSILRAANSLSGAADNAELPAMLLRIPENTGAKNAVAAKPTVQTAATNNETSSGWGKITSTASHKVQAGESWESIAAQYSQAGYIITPAILRDENPGVALKAGAGVKVPLNQIMYSAVAKAEPAYAPAYAEAQAVNISTENSNRSTPGRAGNTLGGAVMIPVPQDLPVATVIEEPPARIAQRIVSVGQGATPRPEAKPEAPATRRGPSVLGSRGGLAAADSSVRVLGQGETAVVEPPTPQPRVIRPNAPAPSATVGDPEPEPEAAPPKIARVAKVAKSGARIRRLPEAEAATLYNTATGTELAVTGSKGEWVSILMSDRSTGWLPAHYVNFTGSRVDISSIKMREPGTSSSRTVRSTTTGSMSQYAAAHPAVAEALKWLGTRYVWGGTSRNGVDCSGLVLNAYRAAGQSLPRVSRDQARVGTPIEVPNLRAGDRLYFSASGRRIDHTGIYMGDGLFVHASGSGRRVMVSNLFDRGNWNIYVGARR